MPKSPPPQWKRRDCSMDHLVAAAVERGFGEVLVYRGIDDIDRAQSIRRGIYRCAGHRNITAEAGTVALRDDDESMGIRKERDGTYTIRYRVWTKRQAREAHLARYGNDRSNWPYDPRRPATDAERESWANRDETGRAVIHDG